MEYRREMGRVEEKEEGRRKGRQVKMEGEKKGNTDIAYLPIDLLFNAIYFSGELGGGTKLSDTTF